MNRESLLEYKKLLSKKFFKLWGTGEECTNDVYEFFGDARPSSIVELNRQDEETVTKYLEDLFLKLLNFYAINEFDIDDIILQIDYQLLIEASGISEDGEHIDKSKIVDDYISLFCCSHEAKKDGKTISTISDFNDYEEDDKTTLKLVKFSVLKKILEQHGFTIDIVDYNELKEKTLQGLNCFKISLTKEKEVKKTLN